MNELKIHIGEQEILALEKSWIALQHNPNSDFHHFLLVCNLRKEVANPVAFSYWKKGKCCGIVCGRIEDIKLSPSLGYIKLPSLKTKCLSIIHEGVIGEIDDEGAHYLMRAIQNIQCKHGLDLASFYHLSDRHKAIWRALKHAKWTVGAKIPTWNKHRALFLESKQGFIVKRMNSKHRSYVRRKEKNLHHDFDGAISWLWYNQFEKIDIVIEKLEKVAQKTYQRGLGVGFKKNIETCKRYAYFANKNLLRVMLLEIKERPVCFWSGIIYKNVFYATDTGYLPEFEKYSVGLQTLLRTTDALVKEGIEKIDYGLGDADYKARFSDLSWNDANVHIFRKKFKSKLLMRYIKYVNILDRILRKIISKLELFNYLKKKWRIALRA